MINCATEVSSSGLFFLGGGGGGGVFNTTVRIINNLLHSSGCKMAGHFTHRLYFHSPAAHENMAACS